METISKCILLLSGKKELTKRQNEQALLIFYPMIRYTLVKMGYILILLFQVQLLSASVGKSPRLSLLPEAM